MSHCISGMTIDEIQAYLSNNQSIIVPLGGLEPFGALGAVGISGICSEQLSLMAADTCGSITAPLLPFASSPMFKAFPGCASIGSSTYENVIINICECWIYQGFTRLLLVNSSCMPDDALALALKRLNTRLKDRCEVKVYSWQADPKVREWIQTKISSVAHDRAEQALLCMAASVNSDLVNKINSEKPSVSAEQYRSWKKRGADPEKFRKLFKTGITSEVNCENSDVDLGKSLFKYILECIVHEYSSFLQAKPDNAS